MITVGIDTRPMYGKPAGIGIYVKNLVENLEKFDQELHLIEFGPKPYGFLWHLVSYFSLLFVKKVDYYLSTHSYLLPCLPLTKSILVVHDLSAYLYPQDYPAKIVWETKIFLKPSLRRAKHIIVPSQATKDDLLRLFKLDQEKITVIHHGRPECLGNGELPKNIKSFPFFLFLGTIQPRKNLVVLFEAFAKVRTKFPDKNVKLVIAGQRGWKFSEVFASVKRLGLAKNVIFLGYVSDLQKQALLKKTVALVLPSQDEGYGLPLVEAFACGCPVVCSDLPALREVGGPAPLYFDHKEEKEVTQKMSRILASYLRHDRFYQDLAKKSKERAQFFSWQKTAQQTLDVLKAQNI